MLQGCAHVSIMNPLCASCHVIGVKNVMAARRIVPEDCAVVMPWIKVMDCAGRPTLSLPYRILVMHGDFRIEGLLYCLLRRVYAPPYHPAARLRAQEVCQSAGLPGAHVCGPLTAPGGVPEVGARVLQKTPTVSGARPTSQSVPSTAESVSL